MILCGRRPRSRTPAENALAAATSRLARSRKVDRFPCLVDRAVEIDPTAFDLDVGLVDAPRSASLASEANPPLFEFRNIRWTQPMIVVWARDNPRSAIISTRSRKLSLYRRYQRTQRTMISRSKWRPLKRSSTLSPPVPPSPGSLPYPRLCLASRGLHQSLILLLKSSAPRAAFPSARRDKERGSDARRVDCRRTQPSRPPKIFSKRFGLRLSSVNKRPPALSRQGASEPLKLAGRALEPVSSAWIVASLSAPFEVAPTALKIPATLR